MAGLEFFVPDPDEAPKALAKEVGGEAKQLESSLAPPQVEVELPKKPEPSRNETRMAMRAVEDPDDPSVLLQGMLGHLPNVGAGRAADMAFNADLALNNLGVRAKRMADLERRKERRAKRGR